MTPIFIAFWLWWTASVTPQLEPRITLSVSPTQCLEPCDIKTVINITGYEKGREICLSFYNEETGPLREADRRSCWPWSGRRVTDVTVRNIDAGSYEVSATLTSADNRKDTRMLRVGGYTDIVKKPGTLAGRESGRRQ